MIKKITSNLNLNLIRAEKLKDEALIIDKSSKNIISSKKNVLL